MKKTKIGILKGLLLAGALVFAGCSGVLDDVSQAQASGEATGTVQVQIGSPADARTLAPLPAGIKRYVLGYTKDPDAHDAGSLVYEEVTATKTLDLEPGIWYLSAIGYQDEDKKEAVAKGSAGVTVRAGEAVSVSILLSEAGDVNVPGYFKYDVDWSQIVNTDWVADDLSVTLTLTPADEVSFGNTGTVSRDLLAGNRTNNADGKGEIITTGTNTAAGTIPLPSGVYDLDIAVSLRGASTSIHNEDTTIHRQEKVYIYSYLTTEAPKYTFTDLDLQTVYLTGPRPVLNGRPNSFYAATIEVFVAGERIPFSTSNTAIETQKELRLGGNSNRTWGLYVAGYRIAGAVNGLDSVSIRATWIPGSNDTPSTVPGYIYGSANQEQVCEKPVAIARKQIVTVPEKYLDLSPRSIYLDNLVSAPSYPQVSVNGATFGTSTLGTRTALAGDTVQIRAGTQVYKPSWIAITEHRINDATGSKYDYTYKLYNSDIKESTSSGDVWEFTAYPLSDTDPINGAYTVDPDDTDLEIVAHYYYASDVALAGDIGIRFDPQWAYVSPDTEYYIARVEGRSTSDTTPFPSSAKVTVLDLADQTGGDDGLYLRSALIGSFSGTTTSSWGVPDILDITNAIYLDNRYSDRPAGFADATPYWSASNGRDTGQPLTEREGYMYRVSKTTPAMPDFSSPGVGTGFNRFYTASRTAITYSFTKVGDPVTDPGTFKARVRLVYTATL
jgi:hypothetical protein